MRVVQFTGVLAFMVLLPVGCSEETPDPPGPPVVELGAITGVVHSEQGAPIEGARVTTTPATQAVTTSAEGAFAIVDIAPDTYAVSAAADGYLPAQATDVVVTADQTTEVDLELAAEPVAGATCVTCHLDLDRLYASLEEDPPLSRPGEGGSAGEG